MKEAIIEQSRRKQDTVIHLGLPAHASGKVHKD
jgi:hypothetical protein